MFAGAVRLWQMFVGAQFVFAAAIGLLYLRGALDAFAAMGLGNLVFVPAGLVTIVFFASSRVLLSVPRLQNAERTDDPAALPQGSGDLAADPALVETIRALSPEDLRHYRLARAIVQDYALLLFIGEAAGVLGLVGVILSGTITLLAPVLGGIVVLAALSFPRPQHQLNTFVS